MKLGVYQTTADPDDLITALVSSMACNSLAEYADAVAKIAEVDHGRDVKLAVSSETGETGYAVLDVEWRYCTPAEYVKGEPGVPCRWLKPDKEYGQ